MKNEQVNVSEASHNESYKGFKPVVDNAICTWPEGVKSETVEVSIVYSPIVFTSEYCFLLHKHA
jgi:hypothetical protein